MKENRRRRTMLFCPANNPKMLYNAPIYGADCLLFDLEDSIPYTQKIAARLLLTEALKAVDYGDSQVFARINALNTEFGEGDAKELVEAGIRNIRLPMSETPKDIQNFDALLSDIEKKLGLPEGIVKIQASVETPKGVHHVYDIAQASERLVSISFGAEDFTRELGVSRTHEGLELAYARSQMVLAANLAKIDAIDTSFTDIGDMEGFRAETRQAKILGFAGKSCLHPSQIAVVHEIFAPSKEEIEHSQKVLSVAKTKDLSDGGVILVDGKMIDIPVIKKAEHILRQAGLLDTEKGGAL